MEHLPEEKGSELRAMRLLAKLKMVDIYNVSGINTPRQSLIERGKLPLTAKTYKRILGAIRELCPEGITIPECLK